MNVNVSSLILRKMSQVKHYDLCLQKKLFFSWTCTAQENTHQKLRALQTYVQCPTTFPTTFPTSLRHLTRSHSLGLQYWRCALKYPSILPKEPRWLIQHLRSRHHDLVQLVHYTMMVITMYFSMSAPAKRVLQ